MWWPLRRRERGRHAAGRVVFVGLNGPVAPWLPADLAVLQRAAAVLDAVPLPRPVEPALSIPAAPPPAVRLGFADGSSVSLAVDHPAAIALRAVADRLVSASD